MKNSKRKKIIAGVMALCMCLVMAGCGDSSDKSSENITEKTTVQSSTSAESKNNDSAVSSETESEAVESQADAEPITFEPSEEILNADFNSGKIQIGDDIFRNGGYMTVGDFVEKYGDKYAVIYHYVSEQQGMSVGLGSGDYYDIFDPNCEFVVSEESKNKTFLICRKDILEKNQTQDNNEGNKNISNPTDDYFGILLTLTTPEGKERVPVKDAVIYSFKASPKFTGNSDPEDVSRDEVSDVVFYPKDITHENNAYTEELKEKYNFDNIPEYFKSLGLKEYIQGKMLPTNNRYEKINNSYYCNFASKEKNLRGKIVKYKYVFDFNKDTYKFDGVKVRGFETIK